ncbi:SPASM domain-containing protein [Vibrio coralliirubri]|uniref:SPASM domain-containing protein n=1 Tax=Vibrio coralliirubri TaxID=1516159 RepID=UPI0022841173|nr:SPASM domain-containing protein [Vibrio coralliirubri]MCY9866122.1 SPASM domain-containing protein [Vibrio coralliirubri]
MSLLNLSESIDSLKLYMGSAGVNPKTTTLTVCLLGGELTTLSITYLRQVKELLKQGFTEFRDIEIGIQTNLIMTTAKLDDVYRLFNGNIGTSIDNFSDARKFKGSSERYRDIFNQNVEHIKKGYGDTLGGCYVVSTGSMKYVASEVSLAEEREHPLKLIVGRQSAIGEEVFSQRQLNKLTNLYVSLLEGWFMRSSVALEPFLYMLNRKLSLLGGELDPFESCNMTNKCHAQGVCMEPNGDFYFCQELADLKKMKLGNLLTGELDSMPIDVSKFREASITIGCSSCLHFNACKGGCMAYALDAGALPSAKDPYCSLHYAVYSKIDEMLDTYEKAEIIKWKKTLK